MAVLHTSFVKATNSGGRLFDGIDQNNARKNGEFGFLGAYAGAIHGLPAGQTQVKVFEAPTEAGVGEANFGRMPVVIMQPEMMYDDSRKSLLKLSLMEIPAQTPFACVPLEEGDKFDITADALNLNGQLPDAVLVAGKCYVLNNGSSQLILSANNNGDAPAQANHIYFEIVKVKNAHSRSARIGGKFADDNYKLYTMEVKIKR